MKDYTGWEIVEDAPAKNYTGWEVIDDSGSGDSFTTPEQEQSSSRGPQFGSVLGDALSGIGNAAMNTVKAPLQLPGLYREAMGVSHSGLGRFGQNLLAGLAQGGHGLLNTPSNVGRYAEEKGFLPEGWGQAIPRQQEYDFAHAAGINDSQPGDALAQSLARMATSGFAGGPARALFLDAIGQNENPIEAAGNVLIPQGLAKIAGGAANMANRGNAAKGLVEAEKVAQKSATQKYTSIFNTAEEAGAGKNLKAPKVDIKSIKKGSPDGKFIKSLEQAQSNPTLENINKAQSDLGKFIRNNENKPNLPSNQIKALHEASKAQQQYKDTLYKAFEKAGKPELVDSYIKANEFYKNEVVPYRKSKPLQEFKRGERTAPGLVKSLAKSDKFKAQLGKKHPEVKTSHALNAFGKFDPIRESGGAGLDLLAKILKGEK